MFSIDKHQTFSLTKCVHGVEKCMSKFMQRPNIFFFLPISFSFNILSDMP